MSQQAFIRLAADFTQRVVVRPEDHQWVASPMAGVERMMLDRVGGEVARATSLVRYAPHSSFSPHSHGGGEEFLVLSGVFSDEHGDYPAGTYVRNPIGTAHQPHIGPEGCVIFVKLHQFEAADQDQKAINLWQSSWRKDSASGCDHLPLHQFGNETVAIEKWQPDSPLPARRYPDGAEILVLEGSFSDEDGTYGKDTWLRLPPGAGHAPVSGDQGTLVYIKMGHLPPKLNPDLMGES